MDIVGIALIVALLACPLMMLLAHRGMAHRTGAEPPRAESLSQLRRRRDEIDAAIRAREEREPSADGRERAPGQPSAR